MIFQTLAQITKVSTQADKSIKIVLSTPELDSKSKTALFDLANREGWMAFKEVRIKEEELNIPESVKEFKSDKTPSQRLRSVIYVFWQQHKQKEIDFDTFYRQQVEKMIEYLKDKLN